MVTMDSDTEDSYMDSDDELRDMFAKGIIKPGLNVEMDKERKLVNNVVGMNEKLAEFEMKLDWIERLDMVNDLAPLAPEYALQLEQQESKRANMFAANAKLKYIEPDKDPVLNDFKREMLFHRQAQSAVLEGIKKIHALGKKTKRPDDYFAEMAKTDDHMQKVRKHLVAKQEGQAKSEKVKQIREQRKMGKKLEQQSRVKKEMEKKETLDQLKKFRKGKLKNLDFLDDNKGKKRGGGGGQQQAAKNDPRNSRNKKFGFGGKKKGSKRNDKKSAMGVSMKFKGKAGGGGGAKGAKVRPGKSKRAKTKNTRK